MVACNPDKGCDSNSFKSCLAQVCACACACVRVCVCVCGLRNWLLAQVAAEPGKERELLDMQRAEVVKLAEERKNVLVVKQLSSKQCVLQTCSEVLY